MAVVHVHPSHPLARRRDTRTYFVPPQADAAVSDPPTAMFGAGLAASVAVLAAALLFAVL